MRICNKRKRKPNPKLKTKPNPTPKTNTKIIFKKLKNIENEYNLSHKPLLNTKTEANMTGIGGGRDLLRRPPLGSTVMEARVGGASGTATRRKWYPRGPIGSILPAALTAVVVMAVAAGPAILTGRAKMWVTGRGANMMP